MLLHRCRPLGNGRKAHRFALFAQRATRDRSGQNGSRLPGPPVPFPKRAMGGIGVEGCLGLCIGTSEPRGEREDGPFLGRPAHDEHQAEQMPAFLQMNQALRRHTLPGQPSLEAHSAIPGLEDHEAIPVVLDHGIGQRVRRTFILRASATRRRGDEYPRVRCWMLPVSISTSREGMLRSGSIPSQRGMALEDRLSGWTGTCCASQTG
jgi:hypothetical protein